VEVLALNNAKSLKKAKTLIDMIIAVKYIIVSQAYVGRKATVLFAAGV
jgi:hypothetical protein